MAEEILEITQEEINKIYKSAFSSLEPLKIKMYSSKGKKKIVVLQKIAEQFEKDKQYTEKEVNGILSAIYEDYATIRRDMIECKFIDRTKDGKTYWAV